MTEGERVEERVLVAAPTATVYALVADLPRMGRWSPECVRCDWIGGASSAVPGAQFKGFNRRGWRRWSTKGEVVTAEAGRELSFDVASVFGLPVARWTYRFAPTADGHTEIAEIWEDRRGPVMNVLGRLATGVKDRSGHNTDGMRATLERIKADAEAGPADADAGAAGVDPA